MRRDYIPTGSIVHKLDPRVKFLGFVGYSLLAVLWEDPVFLGVLLLSVIGLTVMAKLPLKVMWGAISPAIPILLVVFLLNFFMHRPPEGSLLLGYLIPRIGERGPYIAVHLETLVFSCGLIFRFSVILCSAMLLTLCTAPLEIALGLSRLGIPAEIGMAISVAISYIPVLFNQITGILEAQQARGWKQSTTKNPIRKVISYFPILIPTFFRSVKSAELMAAALLSRGFGYDMKNRTYIRKVEFGNRDRVGVLSISVVLIVGFYLAFSGYAGYGMTVGLIKSLL